MSFATFSVMDAQNIWKELESQMSTSSKGLNERH